MNFYIDGVMPQAGIDPPAQSHASYEASTLPPSHHGWKLVKFIQSQIIRSTRPHLTIGDYKTDRIGGNNFAD